MSDKNEVYSRMVEISELLLWKMMIKNSRMYLRITAIEFYLFYPILHPDPYVHKNFRQRESATFYIHDNGTRAPNYSGIDITCGCFEKEIFGGVLIREIEKVDGSSLALKKIIRDNQIFNRKDRWTDIEKRKLIQADGRSILNEEFEVCSLHPKDFPGPIELWAGPRLLGKQIKDSFYHEAPYRFALWQTKKQKRKMKLIKG